MEKMSFINYDCKNGIAVPVNPNFKLGDYGNEMGLLPVINPDWTAFETWLKSQPTLHCDPELSGVYPVGEFGEPDLQRWMEFDNKWIKAIKNKAGFTYRYFIEHIGPKKQESNPIKTVDSAANTEQYKLSRVKQLLAHELNWANNEISSLPEVNDGTEKAYFDGVKLGIGLAKKHLHNTFIPATPEQKGVEQARPHQWISVGIKIPEIDSVIVIWNLFFNEEMMICFDDKNMLKQFKHWYPTLGEPK